MSKAGIRSGVVWAIGFFTIGCQTLLGADFDKEYDVAAAGECVETCADNEQCNPTLGTCQCKPLTCQEEGQQCGGFIESRCGQPQDCGTCAAGMECTNAGNGAKNQCTAAQVPQCQPQTCEQLGQTAGVHFSCGVLVNCSPLPNCPGGCSENQVCTDTGCCTPAPVPDKAQRECGLLPDGCGRVVEVECRGTGVCIDGKCCNPEGCTGLTCGFHATKCEGVFLECPAGSCESGECRGDLAHPYCEGACPGGRQCPAKEVAVCGAQNDDGCGGNIQCNGRCPNPSDICTSNFTCCTPHCPTKPEVCGANDNGCGAKIQCPGPCPAGSICKAGADATFSCVQ